MSSNTNKYIIFFIFSLFFSLTLISTVYSQTSTVGGTAEPKTEMKTYGIVPVCTKGGVDVPCDKFEDLILALKKLMNFAVTYTLAFSVVVIAYAGYLYMTSGSNPGNKGKANQMFVSVGKGIFFILGAWLIVNLITGVLLKNSFLTNSILK